VAEKTPNGGETLKVTITNSGTGGQVQTRGHAQEPILRIADSPVPRHERSVTSPDGPEHSSGRSGNAEEPRQPCTFKPRRPEIGTWKTNTFKATGRLVKSSPTFDQLLSKLGICPCVATENTCARIGHCLVMLVRINSSIIINIEVCQFY
jgi:hypothetical protein